MPIETRIIGAPVELDFVDRLDEWAERNRVPGGRVPSRAEAIRILLTRALDADDPKLQRQKAKDDAQTRSL